MAIFKCTTQGCDYVYDETTGDPDFDLPAVPWSEVGDHFCCPYCGLAKEEFEKS